MCVCVRERGREKGKENWVPKTILNCTNCSLLPLHFNAGKYVLPMGTMPAMRCIALQRTACKANQKMELNNEILIFFCNLKMLLQFFQSQ